MHIASLLLVVVSPLLAAEGQPPKPWKGSAEISFVNANGNTKSSTFANKDRFEYASGSALLELESGALRGSSQARLIAEQYFASEKVGYKWTEKDYGFERLRWDKDRFAGINNRYDASLGVGRTLLGGAPNRLVGELGGGRVWEERVRPAPPNDFTAGRAYLRYERALSGTSGFSQDVEYIHSFDHPRDYRLKTETALTAAVTKILSLKTSFVWKRVGSPPAGFVKDDTLLSAALLVTL